MLEINFQPEQVQLSVLGAVYRLRAQPGIFAKVILPFSFFNKAVVDWRSPVFTASFEDGLATFGGTSLESEYIQVVHPENQTKIDHPINNTESGIPAIST